MSTCTISVLWGTIIKCVGYWFPVLLGTNFWLCLGNNLKCSRCLQWHSERNPCRLSLQQTESSLLIPGQHTIHIAKNIPKGVSCTLHIASANARSGSDFEGRIYSRFQKFVRVLPNGDAQFVFTFIYWFTPLYGIMAHESKGFHSAFPSYYFPPRSLEYKTSKYVCW
jgi:hypothetical protein